MKIIIALLISILFSSNQSMNETVHYTERRQAEDINVAAVQDDKEHYQVSIPKYPQSEEQINTWLEEFYIEDNQRYNAFMGIGDVVSGDMTKEERQEAGYVYNTSLDKKRVDDAVISFLRITDTYSNGAHGNSYASGVNFDTKNGKVLELSDIFYDTDQFCEFAMAYIEEVYNDFGWGKEYITDAILEDGWIMTGYGIEIFYIGGNGTGFFRYDIPYEYIVDYMNTAYLPISREAELPLYMGVGARMDVDGDGRIDMISNPECVNDVWEISVNGVISQLIPQSHEESFYRKFSEGCATLVRDGEGVTRLECSIYTYNEKDEMIEINHIYRFEGRKFILEEVREKEYITLVY